MVEELNLKKKQVPVKCVDSIIWAVSFWYSFIFYLNLADKPEKQQENGNYNRAFVPEKIF